MDSVSWANISVIEKNRLIAERVMDWELKVPENRWTVDDDGCLLGSICHYCGQRIDARHLDTCDWIERGKWWFDTNGKMFTQNQWYPIYYESQAMLVLHRMIECNFHFEIRDTWPLQPVPEVLPLISVKFWKFGYVESDVAFVCSTLSEAICTAACAALGVINN